MQQTYRNMVLCSCADRPEEFGAACAFLCSVQASYISGQNLQLVGAIQDSFEPGGLGRLGVARWHAEGLL